MSGRKSEGAFKSMAVDTTVELKLWIAFQLHLPPQTSGVVKDWICFHFKPLEPLILLLWLVVPTYWLWTTVFQLLVTLPQVFVFRCHLKSRSHLTAEQISRRNNKSWGTGSWPPVSVHCKASSAWHNKMEMKASPIHILLMPPYRDKINK